MSSEHCQHELHNGTERADHALQGDFLCHFCTNKNPVPCTETAQAMIDAGTPGNLPPSSRPGSMLLLHTRCSTPKLNIASHSLLHILSIATAKGERHQQPMTAIQQSPCTSDSQPAWDFSCCVSCILRHLCICEVTATEQAKSMLPLHTAR